MLFGVKNGPPTFQRVINKVVREYLDQFMKIVLDDFTIYSDIKCCNPSLGLVTKARACKLVGQKEA